MVVVDGATPRRVGVKITGEGNAVNKALLLALDEESREALGLTSLEKEPRP